MTQPPFVSNEVLDRYLAGEVSAEEKERVEQYLATAPADNTLVDAVRRAQRVAMPVEIGDVVGPPALVARTSKAGEPFPLRRSFFGTPLVRNRRAWSSRPIAWAVMSMAAAALVTYVGSGALPSEDASSKTYVTRAGQYSTVTLPDGSRATLAPQTRMVVESGFSANNRLVSISGQVYFDVVTAARHPFAVRAGHVTSRVLGTEFMVRHFAADPEVLVAVRSGRVAAGGRQSVVLGAGAVARFTDSTEMVRTNTGIAKYIEWGRGRLVFTDIPAGEVAEALGAWYGLTFRFTDSALVRQELSGTFDERDTQQDVLQYMQLVLHAQMTFDGNVVTIMPRRAAAVPRSRINEHPTTREVGR